MWTMRYDVSFWADAASWDWILEVHEQQQERNNSRDSDNDNGVLPVPREAGVQATSNLR